MIGFDFTCYAPRMSFGEDFTAWGDADEFAWRDNGNWPGHDVPNLRGRELTWHLETGQSVFDYYDECMQNARRPMTDRIPDFVEFWRDKAKAMLWLSHNDILSLTLFAPGDAAFVSFMSNVVSSKMSLKVRLPLTTFATHEQAPAPTVDAFMNRYEPVFFSEPAVFYPYHRVPEPVADVPPVRRGFFR